MVQILYWCGLTATQPFNTGVQRVTRCLGKALQDNGIDIVPVKWNAREGRVTSLDYAECQHLAKWAGPECTPVNRLPDTRWLILPEITHPIVPPGSSVIQWTKQHGIKAAAIFYDLIPLQTRELYDDVTIEGLSTFWRSLAQADIILPISQTVTHDFRDWLQLQDLPVPELKPCILSGGIPQVPRVTHIDIPDMKSINLVAIGTWEPRKNYPLILRAIKKAREVSDADIRITIAGRQTPQEYPVLRDEIEKLAAELGSETVVLKSQISDEEMASLIKNSHAMVFGSWLEGFGLPVLESLWQGKPCICHNGSALTEIAPGGGTVMVDMKSESSLADAIVKLVEERSSLKRLYEEAVKRPLKTWNDYALDVIAAIPDVRKPPKKSLFNFFNRRPAFEISMNAQQLKAFSENGSLVDDSLISNGQPGYLIFGPYASLPAGRYKIKVTGNFPWDSEAVIDFVSGPHTYVEAKTKFISVGKTISFTVDTPKDIEDAEIRVLVPDNSGLSIKKYSIRQVKRY